MIADILPVEEDNPNKTPAMEASSPVSDPLP